MIEGWPDGVGRVVLDQTTSTNEVAFANMADAPVWVLAHEQTGGRGRRGRAWLGKRGNLFASLALSPGCSPSEAALRSFVAAVALKEALVALTGREDAFTLKWPNDVLLMDRKVAGILLESSGTADLVASLVIGIGVNLAHAPDPADVEEHAVPPVSVRAALGLDIEPLDLLTPLAQAFARLDALLRAEGFAPVRAMWLASAARLGQQVTARLPQQTWTGRFETVDETGALILNDGVTRHVIPAADIHFP